MIVMLIAAAGVIAQPQLPDWMAGCWQSANGDRWAEECWTAPRGGIMLGSGRTGTGGVLDSWETMQIELIETDNPAIEPLTFYGAPEGRSRTPFVWEREGAGPGISFVNLGHDYPQRIRYWREGRDLVAEVSLADGSKVSRWRYAPMGR